MKFLIVTMCSTLIFGAIQLNQKLESIEVGLDSVRAQNEMNRSRIIDIKLKNEHRTNKIKQTKETIKKIIWKTKQTTIFLVARSLTEQKLEEMATYIVDYCDEYDLSINLFIALIRQESAFDPEAISSTGAKGLTQIVPSTAKLIAKELEVSHYSMYEMKDSIRFGAHYLHSMLDTFNTHVLALAAYNAGPVYVRQYLREEVNLPNETVDYQKSITSYAKEYAMNRH